MQWEKGLKDDRTASLSEGVMAVTMTKPVRAAGLKRKGSMERKQGLECVRLGWHPGSACTIVVWPVRGVSCGDLVEPQLPLL